MKIDSYSFGRITIDGRPYTSDVIIYPGRVDGSWWRKEGHRLQLADLADVLADPPEVLVVGIGASGVMKVDPEVERRMAELGVRLVARRSFEACEEFNRLAATARTVACIHLTC
jgi:hypothetical protein